VSMMHGQVRRAIHVVPRRIHGAHRVGGHPLPLVRSIVVVVAAKSGRREFHSTHTRFGAGARFDQNQTPAMAESVERQREQGTDFDLGDSPGRDRPCRSCTAARVVLLPEAGRGHTRIRG